jgi:hypothetical protein
MCPNDVNMFGVPSKFNNYRTQGRYLGFSDDGLPDICALTTGLNKGAKNGPDTTAVYAIANNMSDAQRNYQQIYFPVADSSEIWHGAAAAGSIRASTWTQCIDNTYVTWPATIRPVPKTLMQEKNKLNDQGIKKYRLQDYFLFLAKPCDTCEDQTSIYAIRPCVQKISSFISPGKILDPKSGKLYKCYITLEENDKLKVRGYIGISLFGRTQYWNRLKN